MKKVAILFFSFLALALLWELCCLRFETLLFILPPPSKILSTLWVMRERFWMHTLCTLKEMVFGFLCALSVAFPLAWVMLRYRTSRSFLQPLFILIQCIPMFTLAPIMVMWFGWSQTAIIVPTALMIFFPLTLNVYQGLRATPRPFLEFFQLNGATPLQTFFKLRLPWALPHIFAGFRISAAVAGVGAVAGEWAGAQKGLGVLMLESRRNTDLEITFAALFCLTLMTISLYVIILAFERWHRRMKISLKPRPLFALQKKCRFALPFFLLLFALTGCRPHEKSTRLLLDWLPNVNHVPLYVGIEKGFFEEEGIHLEVQKMYEGGGGISYLTSNQAELIVGHLPGTLKAASRGAEIKIIAQLIPHSLRALIYRQNPEIKSPSDLSGRVLGYCIGGAETSFLDCLLTRTQIKPIERKNVSTDLISPMGTGAVDFIYGGYWNIEPYQLGAIDVHTDWFPLQDLDIPDYQELVIIANSGSMEAEADFVQHFRSALQKSIAYSQRYPEEAFELFIAANPDKSPRTIAWEQSAWEVTRPLFTYTQEIDWERVENFYQWQLDLNLLTNEFKVGRLRHDEIL